MTPKASFSPREGKILGALLIGTLALFIGILVVAWIGSSAFGLVGTATRLALNLTIALFGLFYLLLQPHATWEAVSPYIPFSAKNTEKLRQRFGYVTTATIIGGTLRRPTSVNRSANIPSGNSRKHSRCKMP